MKEHLLFLVLLMGHRVDYCRGIVRVKICPVPSYGHAFHISCIARRIRQCTLHDAALWCTYASVVLEASSLPSPSNHRTRLSSFNSDSGLQGRS